MVQTAEGALNEVHSMLQRIRELAVEAANSTLSSSDAPSVSTEITALRAEINRIAGATTFNGQNLLTGALSVARTPRPRLAAVGTALNTGHNATVAAIDVSGAKASTTYTITSQPAARSPCPTAPATARPSLSHATIGATGTETVNFGNLGVKVTVVGRRRQDRGRAGDRPLRPRAASTKSIGGASGTDLVNGDVLGSPRTRAGRRADVQSIASGDFRDRRFDGVRASPGVAAGTITLVGDGIWATSPAPWAARPSPATSPVVTQGATTPWS